ncbi:hydroxyacid dehydrogenase [Propionivibrio dicarboxylicus]|uniref:D-3-phosphoglycerate dehydrogenase n=1 Tax=Propionivibrio dicarboxylicus TaxID=83767 RepID=A0A1G7Z755_9RHOO|nr:hydroxyacid dehydrogenase [Propionivibrio dicarboxylicus]SDH04581.1 D-3-phosphoglycerate dehydrogenase [Propionivibrio dicarboxylicus]
MSVVLLSHRLYEDGMKVLERESTTDIANSSDLRNNLEQVKQADGIVLRVGRIGRDLMEACPKLRVISRPGVGVDTVDMAAATELGIPVVIAPGANLRSVAEHAMALIYAITKNVLESHLKTAAGDFGIRNKYAAIELAGKRVGIVGFGNIGKETARICKNNELAVSVYDPFVPASVAEGLGYQYEADLFGLLGACDILSLHMPATPETEKMFGERQFAAMKAGAFLVNCARGEIIDEAALYTALSTGHLAGAAVDVMEDEPMKPDSKLFSLPNFIATPHMAALTKESASRTSKLTAEGTLAVLRGERWPHVANPAVYAHPRWQK